MEDAPIIKKDAITYDDAIALLNDSKEEERPIIIMCDNAGIACDWMAFHMEPEILLNFICMMLKIAGEPTQKAVKEIIEADEIGTYEEDPVYMN